MEAEALRTTCLLVFMILLTSVLMYVILPRCVHCIQPGPSAEEEERQAQQRMMKAKCGLLRLTMKERSAIVRKAFESSASVYLPSSNDHAGSSSDRQKEDKSAVVGATTKEDVDLEEGGEQLEKNEHVCSICLLSYENGDQVLTGSNCNHMFHHDCLVQWLAKANHCDCPCCRREIIAAKDIHDAAVQVLGGRRVQEVRDAWLSPPKIEQTI